MLPPFAFALLTWRECVVGMQPTEMVSMDVRHTLDVAPVSSSGSGGGQTLGGTILQDTLGYVRWKMTDERKDGHVERHLHTEAYDKHHPTMDIEDVWVDAENRILRQTESRTSTEGQELGAATYDKDSITIVKTDRNGKKTTATLYPANGMEELQRRFAPMGKEPKEFVRLDPLTSGFRKIKIEPVGRFDGVWDGSKYSGPSYRFTIDGKEQTLMLTDQNEIVQILFGKDLALVLSAPTKSRRKDG